MQSVSRFSASGKGSGKWMLEKIAKFIFLPSALYVFFYLLLSYKITGLGFYLNLFFVNLVNISILALFMLSGGLLAFLRFNAVMEDYVKSFHARTMLNVLFIAFNIFFFTFAFFSFIYFNFIISVTTL